MVLGEAIVLLTVTLPRLAASPSPFAYCVVTSRRMRHLAACLLAREVDGRASRTIDSSVSGHSASRYRRAKVDSRLLLSRTGQRLSKKRFSEAELLTVSQLRDRALNDVTER